MSKTAVFKTVSYHNFMSFADQVWEISKPGSIFLISGKNQDLQIDSSTVSASNGSGKSNLMLGLMYCIYGQFPSKIHNANILNKYSKTVDSAGYIMRVTLDFDIVEGDLTDSYQIIRGVPKGGGSSIRLILNQMVDGEWKDITKSTSAATQEYIEGLVQMSIQTFQNLVMLSFDPSFNFFRMSGPQKRDFIETLFDTSVYTKMWDLIKKDRTRFSMALQGEKVKLNTLEGQLKHCEEQLSVYAANAKERQKEVKSEIEHLKNDELTRIAAQQKKANEDLDELRKVEQNVNARLEKIVAANEKSKSYQQLIETKMDSLQKSIAADEREKNKHADILSMLCDDCLSKVRSKFKLDIYEQEIIDYKEQLGKLQAGLEKLKVKIAEIVQELAKLRTEKSDNDQLLRKAESSLVSAKMDENSVNSRIDELTRQSEEIKRSLSDPTKIPMLNTQKSLNESIKECTDSIDRSEKNCKRLELCEKVVSPESIRTNIVSRVVKSINDLINQYLKDLNIGIRCELDSQLDKYTIQAPQGWAVDYQNLSKGEQMKLLLATQLAFRHFRLLRLNFSCNCLILDEIVDQNFDTLSISRILDILLEMAHKEKIHVYIISHRSEVSQLTDDLIEAKPELGSQVHRMLVEKVNNISHVVVD